MITADRFNQNLLTFDFLKQHAIDETYLDHDSEYGSLCVLRDPDTGEETAFTGLTYLSYDGINLDGYTLYVNGIAQGQYVCFYGSGQLKEVGHMCFGPDGTRYEFFESGALKSVRFYGSGICLAGRVYDENGSISSQWAEPDLASRLDIMTR